MEIKNNNLKAFRMISKDVVIYEIFSFLTDKELYPVFKCSNTLTLLQKNYDLERYNRVIRLGKRLIKSGYENPKVLFTRFGILIELEVLIPIKFHSKVGKWFYNKKKIKVKTYYITLTKDNGNYYLYEEYHNIYKKSTIGKKDSVYKGLWYPNDANTNPSIKLKQTFREWIRLYLTRFGIDIDEPLVIIFPENLNKLDIWGGH